MCVSFYYFLFFLLQSIDLTGFTNLCQAVLLFCIWPREQMAKKSKAYKKKN